MRRLFLLTLAVFLLSSGISRADDAPAAPQAAPKIPVIGVVDMQTIAMDCDAAKAFSEEMEKKYGKDKANIQKQGDALKKQAEALKNPKTSNEKRSAFMAARQKLEQNTRTFMRKVEQEEMKFRREMVAMVFNATYEVAKAKGYTFVVDTAGGGVLYADRSMDLTKEVLAEVNKIYATQGKKAEGEKAAPAEKPAAAEPEKK